MDKETALEILRERHDSALFSERTALETFIPELKESEDEKMRRKTLKVLNYYKDEEKSEGRMPTEIEECIAWLEKQGEKKFAWKPSDEQMAALSAINVTGDISYAGQGQELINLYNDLKKLTEE